MLPHRFASIALTAVVLLVGPAEPTMASTAEPGASDEARVRRFKTNQQRRMMQGLKARLSRYHARAGRAADPAAPGVRRRRPPDSAEAGGPQGVEGARPGRVAAMEGPTSSYPNVLVNNRATDTATCPGAPCTGQPWSGQCEVSIAAYGSNVVAAWNDGEGFATGLSTQGYAYSTDGGLTWVDGGAPPNAIVGEWTSDPVVAVNEKTGEFYFAALCDPSLSTNGVGVVRGTFGGGGFTWGTPELAVSGNNSSVIYDKEWLAADSTTGNLYLVYARFTVSGGSITTNRIDVQRKTSPGLTWGSPTTISASGDAGRVQGARVAVGPGGEVWATWNAIGTSALDFMRVRRSTTQGSSWGAQVTAVSQFTNFGSGAPGFNRGVGIAFPGLAVDRTSGPNRGRAYLAWNESINFYDDPIGNTGTVTESEPNGTPATGDAFGPGQTLTGSISAGDFDYWSFSGIQGQTIICEFDASTAPALDASFRLFCSDGTSRLAFTEAGPGGFGLIVFTLPGTGTYHLRVAPFSGTGSYSIRTGLNGAVAERARDHRDVFVGFSDNGTAWSTPARVNDDPGYFDNWLPEIAVADVGRPYVLWYDWRDAPASACGAVSHVYLARSDNGGLSWSSLGAVSDAQTAWTSIASNIAPNQGDYIALFGNAIALYPTWADGRFGDPDVFTAPIALVVTSTAVSLAGTLAEPGLVRLIWYAADANGVVATVYRRTDEEEGRAIGRISPDGSGRMIFEDRDVTAGTRYRYRLGVHGASGETFTDEVAVEVPMTPTPALAIQHVRPNPGDREIWVSFSLPGAVPASLELIDVSGRRVRERTVMGPGRQMMDLAAGGRLTPGVYIVRLSQNRTSVVTRVSIVR